jgi:Branched-chain amino acid transport protein (AzlD)
MTTTWIVIAVLCVTTISLKASGPLVLGEREPSERALCVISLVAPAVLTGLVVYETFNAGNGGIAVDERLAGVAVAVPAILLRAPMFVVIVLAAAATAALRALT